MGELFPDCFVFRTYRFFRHQGERGAGEAATAKGGTRRSQCQGVGHLAR